ncbi:hypothetical protein [Pseudomonas asplenii]|uniref:hypothetical protein n=1 Tax=Pseudomonas asplenii TaxID=53407 RepID=UPI002361FE30|nr:hypothetical protein [Pseudomonas asplenii]
MVASTYTKAELLAWLKDEKRMLGWDAIIALQRDATNTLLLQQYIEHFDQGASYWSGIGGFIPTSGNNVMEAISNFTLDVPRLFFEDTGLDNSRANLEMAIVEGSQLTLLRVINHWAVTRISEYSPSEGPRLYLDLLLADVPGQIDGDRRIRLDLKQSSDFRLTFAKTQSEQLEGGRFFKLLFEQLPDDQRIWVMGEIKEGTNPMMQPESFGLRTQQGGAAGEGAILAFVRMKGRHEGGFPGASSGFRYLIPKDAGKDYSATVLLSRGRVIMAQLLKSFGELMGDDDFSYVFDQDNELILATSTGGKFDIPNQRFTERFELGFPSGIAWINIIFGFDSFSIPLANALVLEVKGQEVTARLRARGQIPIKFYRVEDSDPPMYVEYFSGDFSQHYNLSILANYELVDSGGGGEIRLKSFKYEAFTDESGSPSEWAPSSKVSRGGLEPEELAYFIQYVESQSAAITAAATKRIIDGPEFENAIKEAFERHFPSTLSVREFVEENIELHFGNAIVGNEVHSPGDVGFFGRVSPQQTHFEITTPEPLLAAGASHAFQTQPAVSGLRWTVQDLRRSTRNSGSIDPSTGLYQAPQAGQIEGRFTRVRVTATDPATNFRSAALVTVVANPLTINPLISVCDPNERVDLGLGVLGQGRVEVTVRRPGPGSGTIEQQDGQYTYVAGDRVQRETYVLDEVVATCEGQSRSACMLVKQQNPALTVSPVTDAGQLSAGQIQLKTEFNGLDITKDVEWFIAFDGPGQMDADAPGLYHAQPSADARFVCIIAQYDMAGFGTFKGHVILPLPLIEFPSELQMLNEP